MGPRPKTSSGPKRCAGIERGSWRGGKIAEFCAGTALEGSGSQKEITISFSIRFWGVRGSIASPGPETAAAFGNTSSVELVCGDTRILLDAGTGLRRLGDRLLGQGIDEMTVLLSHLHRDHIQGLAERYAERYGRPLPSFDPRALALLVTHDWRGNVRELEHWIESAIVLAGDGRTHRPKQTSWSYHLV